MPKIRLYVEGTTGPRLVKLARACARDLGFRLEASRDDDFRARKGTLFWAIVGGAFVLYVDLGVRVDPAEDGDELEVTLDWSSPWWTGLIGVGRTKSAVIALADELEAAVEDDGGEVVERRGP